MSDLQGEALAVLAELWTLSPDIRLGQLLAHLGFLGEVYAGKGLGYIDDDELLALLYRHRAELRARLEHGSDAELPATDSGASVSGSPTLPGPASVSEP